MHICSWYIWCEDSPACPISEVDLYDIVQQDIYDFEPLGALYIVGGGKWRRIFVMINKINVKMMITFLTVLLYGPQWTMCATMFGSNF